MRTRVTHTYATMEVSDEAYNEIKQKLLDADYHHAIDEDDGLLVMQGIALVREPPPPKPTSHASTSPGPVNCNIRLRFQGAEIWPRTCARCGKGHCPFFNNDGSAKGVDV